jgi:hypothetical protein
MSQPTSGAARGAADATDASETPDTTAGESPVRQKARQVAGRLSALPRLAAAGAARARGAVHHGSDAEREAHRREVALAAAEAGPGTDWAQVGVFSAGIAVGALIGAGAALLLAPATGFETRARLADRARRSGGRLAGRWDELGDDVRLGARRGRKRVARAVTASRWAAEDAWERRRRGER